jgi:SAM-dependent methyltransferase
MKLTRAARKGFGLLTNARLRRQALNAVDAYLNLSSAECPICGFIGKFESSAETPVGSVCASCRCWERHRLFALALQRGFFTASGKIVLNCSPEKEVWELIDRANPASHQRIGRELGSTAELFIGQIALSEASVDLFVAVHCFEHADQDEKAMAEVFRVLKSGGHLVAMVPLIEGWSETYEDQSVVDPAERNLRFGSSHHVRYYGADFRRRLEAAGFALSEFTAGPEDAVKHGLIRGEKVFLATK